MAGADQPDVGDSWRRRSRERGDRSPVKGDLRVGRRPFRRRRESDRRVRFVIGDHRLPVGRKVDIARHRAWGTARLRLLVQDEEHLGDFVPPARAREHIRRRQLVARDALHARCRLACLDCLRCGRAACLKRSERHDWKDGWQRSGDGGDGGGLHERADEHEATDAGGDHSVFGLSVFGLQSTNYELPTTNYGLFRIRWFSKISTDPCTGPPIEKFPTTMSMSPSWS